MNKHIKYFESDEVNRLYNIWLDNFTENYHTLDMEKWTCFVLSALDNNEVLSHSILEKGFKDYSRPNKNEVITDNFKRRFDSMQDLYNLLKEENRL